LQEKAEAEAEAEAEAQTQRQRQRGTGQWFAESFLPREIIRGFDERERDCLFFLGGSLSFVF
jgi:hypothetical protein